MTAHERGTTAHERAAPDQATVPDQAKVTVTTSATRLAARLGGFERIASVTATLVGTQAVTSALGFVYWTLAARRFSVDSVGLGGAATSAMQLLGSLGMLGLGTLLIAELARGDRGRRRQLVRTGLALATAASFVLGLLFAVVVGISGSGSLSPIGASWYVGLLFAVGVALTGTTLVLDQAVLAIGNGLLQLERNVVASATKIGFLFLPVSGLSGGMRIYLSWTLGTLVSLPLVVRRTRGGRQHETDRRLLDLSVMKGLGRSAASHHALNLALQAPPLLLSIVVAVVLSNTDNGYFSTVRLVAGFVFVLPYAMAVGLFAAAGGDEREVLSRMRLTIPLGLAASLAADVVLYPLAGPVLGAFGAAYATEGLTSLRILVLAGLPLVLKDHFVALRRVQGRTGQAAAVVFVGAVLEVAAAAYGAHLHGVPGLCAAWVITLAVEAAAVSVPLARAALGARRSG